jgi:hypothetical protein
MSEAPKKPEDPGPVAPASPPPDDPATRIATLQDSIKALESEIRTLEGKIANRNAAVAERLTLENRELNKRVERLRKCLYGLQLEAGEGRSPAESALAYETLKSAALDYFKIANVDPELWKNLAS